MGSTRSCDSKPISPRYTDDRRAQIISACGFLNSYLLESLRLVLLGIMYIAHGDGILGFRGGFQRVNPGYILQGLPLVFDRHCNVFGIDLGCS